MFRPTARETFIKDSSLRERCKHSRESMCNIMHVPNLRERADRLRTFFKHTDGKETKSRDRNTFARRISRLSRTRAAKCIFYARLFSTWRRKRKSRRRRWRQWLFRPVGKRRRCMKKRPREINLSAGFREGEVGAGGSP